jgi:hypothetical protein
MRDDFNFKIINVPNMCSNIPASPAYGVYISQLIRYARASSDYSDFLKRHLPKIPAVTITIFKYRNKIGKTVVKAVPYSVK